MFIICLTGSKASLILMDVIIPGYLLIVNFIVVTYTVLLSSNNIL